MHVTTLISVLVAATGAVLIAIWLPGRGAAAPPAPSAADRVGAEPAAVAVAED
jgi:hypothetical protein